MSARKANYFERKYKITTELIYLIQGTDRFIKDVMLVMDYGFGFIGFKIGLPGFTSYPSVNFFFLFFNSRDRVCPGGGPQVYF